MTIELLSPAKNLIQGVAAVNHGADAVYIGAPAFGARQAASNSVADIEQLVKHAHTYGARVYVTLNTILFDNEIEPAVKLIHELYNAEIDALIIQDMGLLECDLPPIALHASTQTHNYTAEKVRFLEQVGFNRVILAREASLERMRQIRQRTTVELEAFVHGALCVSFSGQCYMSQYLSERSGNRGCCTQPCRSKYDLVNAEGKVLRRDEHLLSLRDFNASQHVASMIDAGICSFKIEGRRHTTAGYWTVYLSRNLNTNHFRRARQRSSSHPTPKGHSHGDIPTIFSKDGRKWPRSTRRSRWGRRWPRW